MAVREDVSVIVLLALSLSVLLVCLIVVALERLSGITWRL